MLTVLRPSKITTKVLEEGLEPSSLAACDFESHVYTNSTTPAL